MLLGRVLAPLARLRADSLVAALLVTLPLAAETPNAPYSSVHVNHSVVFDGGGRPTTVRTVSGAHSGRVQLTRFPWLDPSQQSTML